MLSRYGGWIFNEPLALGLSLLDQAIDDKLEDRAWLYYCCTVAYQDKKNRKSFDQLMKELKRPKIDSRETTLTQAEIDRYADIADLMRSK